MEKPKPKESSTEQINIPEKLKDYQDRVAKAFKIAAVISAGLVPTPDAEAQNNNQSEGKRQQIGWSSQESFRSYIDESLHSLYATRFAELDHYYDEVIKRAEKTGQQKDIQRLKNERQAVIVHELKSRAEIIQRYDLANPDSLFQADSTEVNQAFVQERFARKTVLNLVQTDGFQQLIASLGYHESEIGYWEHQLRDVDARVNSDFYKDQLGLPQSGRVAGMYNFRENSLYLNVVEDREGVEYYMTATHELFHSIFYHITTELESWLDQIFTQLPRRVEDSVRNREYYFNREEQTARLFTMIVHHDQG